MATTGQPTALVTGSGKGIGAEVARRLAREGFAVLLNSRSADPARTDAGAGAVKREIEAAGGRAEIVKADVSDGADRDRIEQAVVERFGRLDLLVNNAGVAPAERRDLLEATEESFDRVMGINLRGPYFLTQRLARRMVEWKRAGVAPRPRICFVTSVSAYAVSVHRGEYCVSKAGLSMAAQLFAARLAEFDIPVIEIRPGVVETDMTAGVKEKYDRLIGDGLLPTARWGRPEDVAAVVAAFARGDLDYSTGAALDVSGGFQLRRL